MNNLVQIKHKNEIVITTEQLAEIYGCETSRISENFKRNEDKFDEGKHFYRLEGSELKTFKDQSANCGLVDKHAASFYLWTRRGASRHCKMLGTNKAWEMFDELEETYFVKKPMTQVELIAETAKALLEQQKRIGGVEEEIKHIKQDLPLFNVDCKEIQSAVRKIGVNALGGLKSAAYKDASIRGVVYSDIQRQLKREFQVSSYAAIKHSQIALAMKLINEYKLPYSLSLAVEAINNPEGL